MKVERVRVGDVLIADRSPVAPDPSLEYVAMGVRSFGKGIFHYEPTTGDSLGSLRFFDVKPGRLIVSNIKGWEGAIAVSGVADGGCLASNRFLQYVARDDRIDVRWARWFLLSEAGIELIQRASPGSADRNRTLAVGRFEALELPLPSVDEQRQTATRLDRLAAGVDELKAVRLRSERLRVALPLAVSGAAFDEASTSPTRLGDVLEFVRAPIDVDPVAEYVSIGIRSFGRGLFHYPRRPGAEIGKLRFQAVGGRLLAISNIKAWEGAVATTDEQDEGTVASNRFLLLRPAAGSDAIDYFWALLLSPSGLAALGHASPGSADRNRTLAISRFEDIVLDLPDLETQAAFGRRIRAARCSVDALGEVSSDSTRRVDALLPAALNEAFTGLN